MGINLRLSASPNGTRNVQSGGQGGGAFLTMANAMSQAYGQPVSSRTFDRPAASTADYYHMDGLCDVRPWDLLAMGSEGAAIASAKGFRYVWLFSSDHGGSGWCNDGCDLYSAFSNDPHVFPDASTFKAIIADSNDQPGSTGVFSGFNAWLVYNPDDASFPFYIYVEGGCQGGDGGSTPGSYTNALNMVVHKGANFDDQFTPAGVSHACEGQFGLTAYQRVYRLGTGDWVSFGGGSTTANNGTNAKWTSTDGLTFTIGAQVDQQLNPGGSVSVGADGVGWIKSIDTMGERFQIGSDWYVPCTEDLRGPAWSSGRTYAADEQVTVGLTAITYKSLVGSNTNNPPASSPSHWESLGNLGQYVTLVPVDATTGDYNFTGTPSFIRISNKYDGIYPGPGYLQYVSNYNEDGICTIYAVHGFFNDTGIQAGKLYEDGGGLDEQYIDVYSYVYDATAAQASAPFGVKAKCVAGVVTISWHDLPAGRTYRVKRGTDGATFGTTIGDVTGTSTTDSPTVGSVYYYQVTSLHGGVEQASRVVSTYVS